MRNVFSHARMTHARARIYVLLGSQATEAFIGKEIQDFHLSRFKTFIKYQTLFSRVHHLLGIEQRCSGSQRIKGKCFFIGHTPGEKLYKMKKCFTRTKKTAIFTD